MAPSPAARNNQITPSLAAAASTLVATWTAEDADADGIFGRIFDLGQPPPTASAGGPYALDEGLGVTLAGSGTSPTGLTLIYSWDLDNDGTYGDATGAAPTLTWAELAALGLASNGSAQTIRLRVTDSDGASTTASTTLSIRNLPPTADAGASHTIDEGQGLTLAGSGSDPGGDALTYSWDLDNDGTYGDATGAAPTLTWAQLAALGLASNGSAQTIRLRVTDSDGASTTASTTLSIRNLAPSADAGGPYTISSGQSLTLAGTGSDPGGDAITYSWDLNDDGIYGDATGATPTLTWSQLVALGLTTDDSAQVIRLKVADSDGASSTDTAPLTMEGTVTVAITQTGPADWNGVTHFTVVFSAAVTGFAANDVTLAGTAPGKQVLQVLSIGEDGHSYDVQVGTTACGTVIVSVAAGAATDASGNLSEAAQSSPAFVYKPSYYDGATSTFYLLTSGAHAGFEVTIDVSGAGLLPVCGDWDGDGIDTVGLYDPATSVFSLRNSNSPGPADLTFGYGEPGAGWLPISGDWDGDGKDSIGLYDPKTSCFYLRNSNTTGYADLLLGYGEPGAGWLPVTGDWTGHGIDTIALYDRREALFYQRHTNTTGYADRTFGYGELENAMWPIADDWNGDDVDTIGLCDSSAGMFCLRNSNSGGIADHYAVCTPSQAAPVPVAGTWGIPGSSYLLADPGEAVPDLSQTPLASEALQPLVIEAIARWEAAGAPHRAIQQMKQTRAVVVDLPLGCLGQALNGSIRIDATAAGHGWFVDPTPATDEEFTARGSDTALRAIDPQAVDRVDLLSVVEHELGHIAGLDDLDPSAADLMNSQLGTGTRRNIDKTDIDALFAQNDLWDQ